MPRTLAIRVTSQIATRFRLWCQLESYPFILLSMLYITKCWRVSRWMNLWLELDNCLSVAQLIIEHCTGIVGPQVRCLPEDLQLHNKCIKFHPQNPSTSRLQKKYILSPGFPIFLVSLNQTLPQYSYSSNSRTPHDIPRIPATATLSSTPGNLQYDLNETKTNQNRLANYCLL
jgi:hypothetical protein